VFQGERELVQYNKLLGEFNLEGIAPARRGMPQIEVTFDIDANGIMHIGAKDKSTGKENKITIKSDSGLTKEQIDQMVRDAEANAESDKKQKEIIEARNGADAFLHQVKEDLSAHGEKIKPEEKAGVESAIEAVEAAIKGNDAEAIRKSVDGAQSAIKPLVEAKIAEEQGKAQSGNTDDDVVDATFTETKA
jgi:molecular chaperone DnaK